MSTLEDAHEAVLHSTVTIARDLPATSGSPLVFYCTRPDLPHVAMDDGAVWMRADRTGSMEAWTMSCNLQCLTHEQQRCRALGALRTRHIAGRKDLIPGKQDLWAFVRFGAISHPGRDK